MHPTPTPFSTLGNDQFAAIKTLSRILSNVTAIPPTAPDPMTPRPSLPVVVQPDLPAPSPRVPKLPPTALSPRVTIVPSVVTPYNPPPPTLCLPPKSKPHHLRGCRTQHRDLPSSNLTNTTQFFNRDIAFGHVPVRLPTNVGKPAPNRVMLPCSSNCSNKKNKPTSPLTQPAVRRSNIGTSSVSLTAPPRSRPSSTV